MAPMLCLFRNELPNPAHIGAGTSVKLFIRKSGAPSASDAVARAIILKHVLVSALATPPPAFLAGLVADSTASERQVLLDELQARRHESVRTLQQSGLWELMSSAERAFLTISPEAVSEQAQRDVSWLMEGAECLLWALGHVDALPPYDTQAEIDHLKRLPAGSVRDAQRSATLRDLKALSAARDVAELWHWRSRTRQLIENASPVTAPRGMSLSDVVRLAAEQAASRGDIPAAVEEDFPVFGRSYARASAEQWAQATSIAQERHRALNWLCGYAPRNRWHDTPTDT
jgi:antitoxin component of RelBE/YafQ-DinJ toxin-antitoxin module